MSSWSGAIPRPRDRGVEGPAHYGQSLPRYVTPKGTDASDSRTFRSSRRVLRSSTCTLRGRGIAPLGDTRRPATAEWTIFAESLLKAQSTAFSKSRRRPLSKLPAPERSVKGATLAGFISPAIVHPPALSRRGEKDRSRRRSSRICKDGGKAQTVGVPSRSEVGAVLSSMRSRLRRHCIVILKGRQNLAVEQKLSTPAVRFEFFGANACSRCECDQRLPGRRIFAPAI